MTLKQQRRRICEKCKHYNPVGDRCMSVSIPGHPQKLGYLEHPLGIGNPNTRCPIGKWEWIIPERIKTLLRKLELDPSFLPQEFMGDLLKKGLTPFNELDFTIAFYKFVDRDKFTRGEILKYIQHARR